MSAVLPEVKNSKLDILFNIKACIHTTYNKNKNIQQKQKQKEGMKIVTWFKLVKIILQSITKYNFNLILNI